MRYWNRESNTDLLDFIRIVTFAYWIDGDTLLMLIRKRTFIGERSFWVGKHLVDSKGKGRRKNEIYWQVVKLFRWNLDRGKGILEIYAKWDENLNIMERRWSSFESTFLEGRNYVVELCSKHILKGIAAKRNWTLRNYRLLEGSNGSL